MSDERFWHPSLLETSNMRRDTVQYIPTQFLEENKLTLARFTPTQVIGSGVVGVLLHSV